MKRFMYFSIGVLCLATAVLIGFYIGSQSASAQAAGTIDVQTLDQSGIVFFDPGEPLYGEPAHAVDQFGNGWRLQPPVPGREVCEWFPHNPPAPVPLNEIKFWSHYWVVTTTDEVWYSYGANWVSCGPWPGAPVPISPETWGKIKGQYDRDQ